MIRGLFFYRYRGAVGDRPFVNMSVIEVGAVAAWRCEHLPWGITGD
jgi:hypothetical protein